MKKFIFISLTLIVNCAFAALDISDFSDEQICLIAKNPPLSAQVTFEIEAREIVCNQGVATKTSQISIQKNSSRILKLKRLNKILRGKGPIYSTRSGTNIKINTIGDQKSITIDKAF